MPRPRAVAALLLLALLSSLLVASTHSHPLPHHTDFAQIGAKASAAIDLCSTCRNVRQPLSGPTALSGLTAPAHSGPSADPADPSVSETPFADSRAPRAPPA